jgi:hypothetical protein
MASGAAWNVTDFKVSKVALKIICSAKVAAPHQRLTSATQTFYICVPSSPPAAAAEMTSFSWTRQLANL